MRGFTVRLKAAIVTGALAVGTASVLAAGSGQADAEATAAAQGALLERPDELSAATVARQAGKRVEVSALRNETEQVFANPDGTFTLEQTALPVRVRRDNQWVPVDTTLVRQADGTIAPRASVLRMVFSGGGTGPMVRLDRDGSQLALSWPSPLPVPVLDADTATYPEVLPGVDLKVRADVESMSHVLVVKTAEAARNPALARLRFGMAAQDLAVGPDGSGNLKAVDGSGRIVFRAPPARMWDSSGGSAQIAAVKAPAPNAKQATMSVEVDGESLTLVPDQAMLTGPSTKLPLYIDPAWGAGTFKWIHVNKKFPAEKGRSYALESRLRHRSSSHRRRSVVARAC